MKSVLKLIIYCFTSASAISLPAEPVLLVEQYMIAGATNQFNLKPLQDQLSNEEVGYIVAPQRNNSEVHFMLYQKYIDPVCKGEAYGFLYEPNLNRCTYEFD